MTERERIMAVLRGGKVDRLPWCGRLNLWLRAHRRAGTLPGEFAGQSEAEIYRSVRMGRLALVYMTTVRLSGVEMWIEFDGVEIRREMNPLLHFPNPVELVGTDQPGETAIYFETPVGTCSLCYVTNAESLSGCAQPYLTRHIISDDEDYAIVQWLLSHSEVVADYEPLRTADQEIGDSVALMS